MSLDDINRKDPALGHVNTWVFDLDNTLYPADAAVMSQVEARMTEFVMQLTNEDWETARKIQKSYFRDYGTTLNGLMHNHDINQAEFLDFVHDVDHSVITPDPTLAQHIANLDGPRYVFTNGSRKHAEQVIHHLGLNGLFDDLFDIASSAFTPKPHQESFDRFTRHFAIKPQSSVMFEDSLRNLETAARLGFTTVLVGEDGEHRDLEAEKLAGPSEHVHFTTDHLREFLGDVHTHRRRKPGETL